MGLQRIGHNWVTFTFTVLKIWTNAQWVFASCLVIRANVIYHFLAAQMVKNLPAMRRPRFDPWVGKILWKREWQPTPVFLPGEFHGQRSLVGYSPWSHKEWDTTEQLTCKHTQYKPGSAQSDWQVSYPHLSLTTTRLLLISFKRRGKWGTEMFNHFPEFAQRSGRVTLWIWLV